MKQKLLENKKNKKKGAFKDKVYLINVEQEQIDEREEKELNKEWRKNILSNTNNTIFICDTRELIEQIQRINILNYEGLKKIANRIEMIDKNYTSELKQIIIDKADIIKLNNLKEKYNNDEKIKKELLTEIKEIAAYYGTISGNQKNNFIEKLVGNTVSLWKKIKIYDIVYMILIRKRIANMTSAVFMSIKEIHMNRILSKIKNHEFRTKKLKNEFDYIIVYVPAPIKELKYILKVKQPVASPNKISINGYGNKEFNNVSTEKYAYPIESVYEINKPIKLDILKQEFNFTAPQSFAYGEKYKELLDYIDKVGITKLY